MEVISIIVPVYNVEKYLIRCVDSILKQTYTNLEILLVNDGSTDSSGSICDSFASIDSRIKVIHKKNGGLSDARNTGIKIVTGQYIGFVDSDDWINPKMYEKLYKNIKKHDADISICGFSLIEEVAQNSPLDLLPEKKYEIQRFTSKQALEILLTKRLFHSNAWDKLYTKELFENIEYPKGRIYEDIATTYKLICKANGIVYCAYPGYNYLQRQGSLIHSHFNAKLYGMVESYQEMLEYIKINYNELIKPVQRLYVDANIIVLKEMYIYDEIDFNLEEKLILNIREYMPIYLNSRDVDLKHKLLCLSSVYYRNGFKLICRCLKNTRRIKNNEQLYRQP